MDAHPLTITPELNRLLKRDVTRALVFTPQLLLIPAAVVVLLALVTVSGDSSDLPMKLTMVVVTVVIFGGLIWMQRRRVARLIDTAFPVGSAVSGSVQVDGLHLSGATGSSVVAYRSLKEAQVKGSAVLLRQRAGGVRLVHPAAVFADAELDELRQRIAGS